MKKYIKTSFPVSDVRRFLEPTPTVLLSSLYEDRKNVMAMGWYTIMEFVPSLIGCMISKGNFSYDLIKKSKECTINIPTSEIAELVVNIGNCSGNETDKFETFDLEWSEGDLVKAPILNCCHSSFECTLYDDTLVKDYHFFIFEIVKAHVAMRPKFPKIIQYRGNSQFLESGKNFKISSLK